MGRKIPGKKHRHTVDPEKQRAKRIQSLKDKINNPPKDPDEQEVPRSLLKIIELKNACRAPNVGSEGKKFRKKKRKKNGLLTVEQFLDKDVIQPGMKKPDKFIPNLVQRPQEPPEKFLSRVSYMTQKIIKEVQFENKFGVTIKKDMKTGKVLKVEKNRKGILSKQKAKQKEGKKTLSQKRKEKKLRLQKAKMEDAKDLSYLTDVVEFGEVVHRPPTNLKPNSTAKQSNKNKYKNLLLQGLISDK